MPTLLTRAWSVLRAGLAWRLVPVCLAVELYAVFTRGTPWLGEWNWTTDWINGATVLTMPLVGACAAYDASSMLRRESRALVISSPRGLLGFTWPTWSTFLALAPVHAVGLLVGFALNLRADAGGSPSLASVPIAFTALAAAAAIGHGVGLALPQVVAAPVAGVVLLALNVVGAGNLVPQFMRIGGATGTLAGLTWDPRVLILDLLIHLALVVGLTWGLAQLLWPRTGRAPRATTLGGCVLAALISLLALQWNTWPRLRPATESLALVCHQARVEVCLAETTSRKLSSLSAALDEQVAVLEAARVAVPRRFEQVASATPRLQPGTAPLFIESDVLNSTRTSAEEAAAHLTQPAFCPQLVGDRPPPPTYFEVRRLLELWLLASLGELTSASVADPALQQWLVGTPTRQADWVATTYAQLTACRLADVSLPTLR